MFAVLFLFEPADEVLAKDPGAPGFRSWLTEGDSLARFSCPISAALVAAFEVERRSSSRYRIIPSVARVPFSPGELVPCRGPDLSGLGGFFPR